MTRRIALAILLTVWTTLVVGGVVVYATTRSLLLADLDASLVRRARGLKELREMKQAAPNLSESAGDRYVITTPLRRTLGRLPASEIRAPEPLVESASTATLGDGSRVRSVTLRFTPSEGGEPVTVIYSGSAERCYDILRRLEIALAVFGLWAGAGAAGAAILVSRAALRPLRETGQAIGAIDERRLDRRIDPTALPVELHPVAARLNEMLDRLQSAFNQRKQFLADASHELRTPVAALVTTIEVALRRPRGAAEMRETLRVCLSDARMLRQLVQALMEHARSDSAAHRQTLETFDAAPLLHQCADVAEGLAIGRDVTVRRLIPDSLEVTGHPMPLRGIVTNLMGNAVEHNHVRGWVELLVQASGRNLEIVVSDNGPGIPPDDLSHVFEPFYRAKTPASGADEGAHLGLGLFLVDSHIKAMGGTCQISSTPGVGTSIRVRIPAALSARAPIMEASLT